MNNKENKTAQIERVKVVMFDFIDPYQDRSLVKETGTQYVSSINGLHYIWDGAKFCAFQSIKLKPIEKDYFFETRKHRRMEAILFVIATITVILAISSIVLTILKFWKL